jgi:hypothetical protein
MHALIFSKNPEEMQNFLRDIVSLPSVDAGGGWPIFAAPPTELAVHDANADEEGSHELYLMCDDVHAVTAKLAERGVTATPIIDRGWGLVTRLRFPSGDEIGLYQPNHPLPVRREPAK